jgi:hypothetical protein
VTDTEFAAGDGVRLYNAPEVEGVITAVRRDGTVDVEWEDGAVERQADPSALVLVHPYPGHRTRPPTAAPVAYRFRSGQSAWVYVDASETGAVWLEMVRRTPGYELETLTVQEDTDA